MKKKIIARDKYHLKGIIFHEIGHNGNECYLNHIDISKVCDLSEVFAHSEFNGDISKWNTSHVVSMENMFYKSKFNGDISNWNVSNVEYMEYMFCYSEFSGDLSNWKPYKLECTCLFDDSFGSKPYWAEYENKNERINAINAYHLKNGIVKELNQELNNINTNRKRIKV